GASKCRPRRPAAKSRVLSGTTGVRTGGNVERLLFMQQWSRKAPAAGTTILEHLGLEHRSHRGLAHIGHGAPPSVGRRGHAPDLVQVVLEGSLGGRSSASAQSIVVTT